MEKKTQRELVVRKLSFAEAEEADIEYYAGLNWKESAAIVEEMRKLIWNNEYKKKREEIIKKSSLKEDRDDFK
jgi:hypothetical protein